MSNEQEVVRYEERDHIAIITLNRPEKLNTLTEDVVQGVADAYRRSHGVPRRARRSSSAGEGRVFTAGYDLVVRGRRGRLGESLRRAQRRRPGRERGTRSGTSSS